MLNLNIFPTFFSSAGVGAGMGGDSVVAGRVAAAVQAHDSGTTAGVTGHGHGQRRAAGNCDNEKREGERGS